MKTVRTMTVCLACFLAILPIGSQTHFDLQSYRHFLEARRDMSAEALLSEFALKNNYYKGNTADTSMAGVSYLDSIRIKFSLTPDELGLLRQNHFMVSERLSFNCMAKALDDVFVKDLPVMVTTDAVLQALHASYDRILSDVEIAVLEPKLDSLLSSLYRTFPDLTAKYRNDALLADALADVDLYVTAAKSLLDSVKIATQFCPAARMDRVWDALQSEKYIEMPLFSNRNRKLDFSQFTVRGHYTREFWDPATQSQRTLGPYFRSMMWLGRIDFLLTPPPAADEPPWTREEIRRMNLGALMLNELVDAAGARTTLNSVDEIIRLLVGESDNLTPEELARILADQNIPDAADLLDDPTYDAFQSALISTQIGGQRILSDCFVMDRFSSTPDTLPVSFRLLGQRFIVDSYIFSNLVYDRIIFQNEKIWRPMPDPLDAAFVLGNDNALPLLKNELDHYHYASQAASLRYLVDAYDPAFWDASLYHAWLNAIRLLNPAEDLSAFPFFMRTAAWQQEKLNTQLASWAQLRHDNLLYAKQSYTGMTSCSFPHSYVEPYPDFYRQIARFAERAEFVFSHLPQNAWPYNRIMGYFPGLKTIASRLEGIARKELNRQAFIEEEIQFLKTMMIRSGGVCGETKYPGWYSELFYDPDDMSRVDYLVADVHTQPTDEPGNLVGRILHVGVGKVNLGVFLADSPSSDFQPMAYAGPVMSYYQTITENFDRLTDERWANNFGPSSPGIFARPDWVNIYLADVEGKSFPPGRELKSMSYNGMDSRGVIMPDRLVLDQNYPNPFNPSTRIAYTLPGFCRVRICIYDRLGRKVDVPVDGPMSAGRHILEWKPEDLPSGVYLCRIQADAYVKSIKLALVR